MALQVVRFLEPAAILCPATSRPCRARWEWGHALHTGVLFGFAALVVSILVDRPTRP